MSERPAQTVSSIESGDDSPAALRAEVEALRQQVAELTRNGHELVSIQTRMQSLLHNASDAIIQFDAESAVVTFNRAAERVFGYAEIELMYQTAEHLFRFPVSYQGDVPTCLKRYCDETRDQFDQPLVGVTADGSERLLEVSVAHISATDLVLFDDFSDDPEDDTPSFEAVMCIFHDITEAAGH